MNWPLVSIITINYDHPEITCEMLAALRKISYPNVEVIVVDNASPNDDPEMIRQRFPEVKLLRSKKNIGFAGGNNLGIRQAKGDYILLLNNDTEPEPGFLEPLVMKLKSDPGIGAVSPKIRFFHEPDTFQYAGLSRINPYTIRSHGIGYREKDRGQYDADRPTEYVHGAAMLVPREVVRRVGLMAEQFFLYYEELDWGIRIKKAGYQLWYVHNSLVLHKESISTGKKSALKTYYMNRARILYLRRNVHGLRFLGALMFLILFSVPRNMFRYLIEFRPDLMKAYHRALIWHVKNIAAKDIHSNPIL